MRHDLPVLSDPSPSGTTALAARVARPSRAIPRVRAWAWPAVLGALVVATCLTVALYASAWLVPPYLVVMTAILGVPRGLRLRARALAGRLPGMTAHLGGQAARGRSRRDGNGPTTSGGRRTPRRDDPDRPEDGSGSGTDIAIGAAGSDDSSATPPDAPGTKPRRGRGRPRKSKPAPALEPAGVTPTWVRVGPGKFVRADAADALPVEPDPGSALEPPAPGAPEAADRPHDAAHDDHPAGTVQVPVNRDRFGESARHGEPLFLPDPGPAARAEDELEDNGNAPDASTTPTAADVPHENQGLDQVVAAPEARLASRPRPVAQAAADAVPGVADVLVRSRPAVGHGPLRTEAPAPVGVASRWNGRAGRISRVHPGSSRPAPARRNLRHSGRFHHASRINPPRSPPAFAS